MRPDIASGIEGLVQRALRGVYGTNVQQAQLESSNQETLPYLAQTIDSIVADATPGEELVRIRDLFWQLLLVIYRDAHRKSPDAADALLRSLVTDFPETKNTALWSRWYAVVEASFAIKAVAFSKDELAVWQATKTLFRSYNELLNGLFGFLLACIRASQGKSFSANTFKNAYGAKANEFNELTGGDDGAFYLFSRVAKSEIRNAIAHDTIALLDGTNRIQYPDRDGDLQEIGIVEFSGLAAAGNQMAQAYFGAIATIIVHRSSARDLVSRLPERYLGVLEHRPKETPSRKV